MKRWIPTVLAGLCVACSSSPTSSPATSWPVPASPSAGAPTEKPIPLESSPPGDIPDNQAFVTYHAAGGFDFKFPEGWARTATASRVVFTDRLNAIQASWTKHSDPPTTQRANDRDVPELRRSERAFELRKVSSVKLPAGTAVLIEYRANSAPNDVTGKQYRLDVLRYELFRAGTEVDLTLSSPVGSDNVDPWAKVTGSVAWP